MGLELIYSEAIKVTGEYGEVAIKVRYKHTEEKSFADGEYSAEFNKYFANRDSLFKWLEENGITLDEYKSKFRRVA